MAEAVSLAHPKELEGRIDARTAQLLLPPEPSNLL